MLLFFILIYAAYILTIAFTLFLAGKDATSFLLKDQSSATILTYRRIKRWHRDGVVIWLLFVGALSLHGNYWQIPVMAVLVRVALFDVAFNHWAQLPVSYLGSTALSDKFFIKIFGMQGAVKKAIAFLLLSIIFLIIIK